MKTRPDSAIEEVRRVRMELSAKFGHDIRKLCAFLRKEERKHPDRFAVAPRSPRARRKAAAA